MATFSLFKTSLRGPLLIILSAFLLLDFVGLSLLAGPKTASTQSRRRSAFFRRKMTEKQKRLLSPSAEDLKRFAAFLRQDDTGMLRLLPRGKYEFSNTISVDRDPDTILPIRGGGAFYSFTEKKHDYGPWSEITLQDGRIVFGFTRESLGLLTAMGDLSIESVTIQSPPVESLTRYKPPDRYAEALADRKQLMEGMNVEGFTYYSAYPALPHSTYVARSVIYKKEGHIEIGRLSEDIYRPHPSEYRGADLILAFHIVRRDSDGSLIILWKRLKKFRSQKLKGELRNISIEELEEIIEKEAPRGSNQAQIMAFLSFRGISNSHFIEKQESLERNSSPNSKRIISASIPNVRGKRGAKYNIQIKFFFDEDQNLIDRKIEKISR